jgi:hypothetical protein
MATIIPQTPPSRFYQSMYEADTNSTPGIAYPDVSSDSTGLSDEFDELSTWRQKELCRELTNKLHRLLRDNYVSAIGSNECIDIVAIISMPPTGKLKSRQIESTLSIPKLIAGIRASLSLQIKEIAEMLQVERPTIYAWIKDKSKPHKQNRERLNQLYYLAKQWDNISNNPIGKAIHDIVYDGRSLFDYLKESNIQKGIVLSCFAAIKHAAVESAQRNNGQIKKSVAELAREHGIDLSHVHDQEEQIDVLTGKRYTLD